MRRAEERELTLVQKGCVVLGILMPGVAVIVCAFIGLAGSVLTVSNMSGHPQKIAVTIADGRTPFAGSLASGFESTRYVPFASDQSGVRVSTARGCYVGYPYMTHPERWHVTLHEQGVEFCVNASCEELVLAECVAP